MLFNSGKVAWVTGSSGFLGSAIAEELQKSGFKVAWHGTRPGVKTGENSVYVQGDCSDPMQTARMVNEIESSLGQIACLVCCAGGLYTTDRQHRPSQDTCFIAQKDFDAIIRRNLYSAVVPIQAVVPKMIAKQSGRIITIGSNIVNQPRPTGEFAAYSAAKSALHEYTLHLSKQLLDNNILVNCLAPGTVPKKPVAHNHCTAEGFAKLVRFMLTEADQINGQIIRYNGGKYVY